MNYPESRLEKQHKLSKPEWSVPVQPSIPQSVQPQPYNCRSDSDQLVHKSPARPDLGTIGERIMIATNHFLVEINRDDIFEYDVEITPEVSSEKCREIMIDLGHNYRASHFHNQYFVYDGKRSLFTSTQLCFYCEEFVVNLHDEIEGQERAFKVSIKFTALRDLRHLKEYLNGRRQDYPQQTFYAVDVVLRESASTGNQIVGKSIFSPSSIIDISDKGALGNGVDFKIGFSQCLSLTQSGLFLNVDLSAMAFYSSMTVLEYLMEFFDTLKPEALLLSDQERLNVEKVMRGVKVFSSHEGYKRIYIIQSITPTSLINLPVDDDDRMVSVVQYFNEKYKITLKYPYLPGIQAVGTDAKPMCLPMELCTLVEDQPYSKKLNDGQMAAMLRVKCTSPGDHKRKIDSLLKENYNQDKPMLEDFGLQIKNKLTLNARLLPPPALKYYHPEHKSEVYPRFGRWKMKNLQMFNGATVKHWALINFSNQSPSDVGLFYASIISMCRCKGMVFSFDPLIVYDASPLNIRKELFFIHDKCNDQLATLAPGASIQLLLVILPEVTTKCYGKIKRICETELGIISQCFQPFHVKNPSQEYRENVALKINNKVGGTNVVMAEPHPMISDRPTIIFGAHVNHRQPKEDSRLLSIAALVASMDWPNITKYRALVSAQPYQQEIIEDLYKEDAKGMIRDQVIAFEKRIGEKPQRIIFYRGGVSEDQFNDVFLQEMKKLHEAFKSFGDNYRPPVTYIFVQKGHHTRFYPMNHNDTSQTSMDKSGNILPGTVVDTNICHPRGFDFYLCSHAGIEGTSCPAHYHVIYDENKFTVDNLQTLTNDICYTFALCTRSVSIATPAYYAHRAASRARYYSEDLSDSESESDNESESRTHGGRATRKRTADLLPMIHDNVKELMFYC